MNVRDGSPHATAAARARAYLAARRIRSAALGDGMFGDPAWDMLVDLFASRMEGQVVSVSSVCLAADAPTSTALRWLAELQRRGLVRRRPDLSDRRRNFVELSEQSFKAVGRWLDATYQA